MNNAFQKSSTNLFTLSFFLRTAILFANSFLGPMLRSLSDCINLVAYGCWLAASALLPSSSKPKLNTWYGLISFKGQNIIAAMFGVASAAFFIFTILIPVLIIPASWCSAISNLCWYLGEKQRYHNPPNWDDTFVKEKQEVYLEYAVLTTGSSFTTTILMTLGFCFPALTAPLLTVSGVMGFILSASALQYWLAQYNFPDSPEPENPNGQTEIREIPTALSRLKPEKKINIAPPMQPTANLSIHQRPKANALQYQIRHDAIEQTTVLK